MKPPAEPPSDKGLAPIQAVAALAVILAIVAAAVLAIWVMGVRARHRRAAQRPEPSAAVALLAPRGGVGATPRAFTWKPVAAAASYKVTIGDDDALWPIFVRTTTASSLPLDEKDAAAIAAGRIHMWEVVALDAAGHPVAVGMARFRVRLPGEDTGSEPLF